MASKIANILFEFMIYIIILAAIGWAAVGFFNFECHQRSSGIGLPYRWVVAGGCQIEFEPDKWIPLENYRVIPK